MDSPSALQVTFSEALAGGFKPTPEEFAQLDVLEAAAQLIAAHYRLDLNLVRDEVFTLEVEGEQVSGGLAWFGTLLEAPWGFMALGLRVAERLLGLDDAHSLPRIQLSYH